jgi:uncharacterized protein (DUF1015 family)
MAEILPFRALRYSRDRVPYEKVVTQPYDKISPERERRYLDAHTHNIVRIIRPGSNAPSDPSVSRYQHAQNTLTTWRREGVIGQISEPSLYAYFQRFRTPGTDQVRTRKGVICLTRLEDYANKVIFPHEQTLTGPKQDRLELLRHTRTHFGQVFLLYSDPENTVDAILDGIAERSPHVSIRDEYDVEHILWRVPEPVAIGAIRLDLAARQLVIADGHHRYETALAFRDEKRKQLGVDDAGAAEWLMTTLVNMDSPGMTILPTHRMLSGLEGFDPGVLLASARNYFDVREVDRPDELERSLVEGGVQRPSIGLAVGESGGQYLFELREGVDLAHVLPDVSRAQAGLDVVILHRLVLGKCLGISEEQVRGESYLRYIRGFGKAVDQVRAGRAQAAFLLNATRLDQVRDIALGGEVLPQKSTDFFPKMLSGLTMYTMD